MNKLLVINRGLSDLLYADQDKALNIIAGGAETFIRNSSKKYGGTECIYRISQNGIYHVYPFMTKRIFHTDLKTFLFFLNKVKIPITEIENEEFKAQVDKLSCGCFVLVTKINESEEEAMVLHRHHEHINLMISDLNLHKMRACLNKHF